MKSLANEFFQTMEKGARDYQAQHADEFELISNGIKNEPTSARKSIWSIR
jgi:ribose transport system substrate-binding protein